MPSSFSPWNKPDNALSHAVHTMAELKLSGNHLKGSRPILSFDSAFDQQPHLQLMKEMFTQSFATPRRHPKSKPFHDHVITFHFLDNRIWLRNYQVCFVACSNTEATGLAKGSKCYQEDTSDLPKQP